MTDDQAAVSMSYICSLARPRAELTMLTGSGADETTSDYGFRGRRFYSHSQFGGFWPDDSGLQDLFPWHSFYNVENWVTLGFTDGLGIGVIESARSMRGE